MTSNGEVEAPGNHVSAAPRARNFDWVPPLTTHASRPNSNDGQEASGWHGVNHLRSNSTESVSLGSAVVTHGL